MAELLSVPLKSSSDVDIEKPLRNLIQATYGGTEGVEESCEAVSELARLRAQAIWKLFDKTSLDVIYNYYDQLVSLESKVPPQEVSVPFKWKDAFDRGSIFGKRMSLTVSSLAFERVCVLWNIAALQSARAAAEPLDTEDSLKTATKLCQQAAGIFSHLRSAALPAIQGEPTPDLSAGALAALAQIMLAQAQELVVYKCIRDEMKDSMIAKVCSACEDMYGEALRLMNKEPVKGLWDRDWTNTVTRKQAKAKGLAQLYQALSVRSASGGGGCGEAAARLGVAVSCLGEAGAAGEAARAQRLLSEAHRDNDFIYHERVPEPAQLEPIPKAPVARALPLPQRFSEHKDLFAGLVSLSEVRARREAAAARRDSVQHWLTTLREHTQRLNSTLTSLSLPACVDEQDSTSAASIPGWLLSKMAAVRGAGGAAALQQQMSDLPTLLQRNTEILDETERMLREESEADAALRAQFGSRWARSPSGTLTSALTSAAANYRQLIDNAVRADHIVQQKYKQHAQNIALLSGSEEALSAALPTAAPRAAPPAAAAHAHTLRELCRQVEELKSERDRLEQELKGAVEGQGEGGELAPLEERARASVARQEQLVNEIQSAHSSWSGAGGGGGGAGAAGAREAALGALGAAADAHAELSANLHEGTKFYGDLTQLLLAFQNKVNDFCFARKTEKDELLKDLTQAASRPAPPAPPPAHPPQHSYQQPAPEQSAPPAALPYPTQPMGMPLPYAPMPHYAAMPPAYNPYATLPFPHPYPYQPPHPHQPPH